jgi:hypothetical protein
MRVPPTGWPIWVVNAKEDGDRCHRTRGARSGNVSTNTSSRVSKSAAAPEDVAEEIAARTVNKERARSGEAETSSRSSTDDISSGRRGGLRSHRGPGGPTYDQLYNEARQRGIKGRSRMNKRELARAVGSR